MLNIFLYMYNPLSVEKFHSNKHFCSDKGLWHRCLHKQSNEEVITLRKTKTGEGEKIFKKLFSQTNE